MSYDRSNIANRVGEFAFVQFDPAAISQGLGIVGILGERFGDAGLEGLDLMKRVERIDAQRNHVVLVANQIAGDQIPCAIGRG